MEKIARIFIAGHGGMVGSALVRNLQNQGYCNLILRNRKELDLCNQTAVEKFFTDEKPDYVFLAAAKVGGIIANDTQPGSFVHDNLLIQTNIIHGAYKNNVKRLLFLGSTCIYPKLAPQPMKEEYLLTGSLEPTNEGYAIAKIAGITMCRSYNRQYGTRFLCAMPNNLYGINDNFDLTNSHVMPALMRKFHEAKAGGEGEVIVWGSGSPLREFMHVDDLADACIFLMNLNEEKYGAILEDNTAPALINVGSGQEISIKELALLLKKIVGFNGTITFDRSKPDGTPRKLSDAARLHNLGWQHHINLEEGIIATYQWFLEHQC